MVYDKIAYINAIVIGHVLAFWAIFLNWDYGNDIGIVFAVLGISCAYFSQSMYSQGTKFPKTAIALNLGTSVMVAISYLIWLYNLL